MKNIYPLIFSWFLLLGFQGNCQLPVITVRFANPQYNSVTQSYGVDIEFQSNTANQKLYGMNVRLFYDDIVLEYQSMNNFVTGYSQVSPIPPNITTSNANGGSAWFGFPANHPFEFFNGAIQLTGSSSLYLSTTGWTRIFTMWFHVDDPSSLNSSSFCPSLIWDLEVNPVNGGWLNGDDGVVISVAAPAPAFSSPSTENVVQHNWQYSTLSGTPYGSPVSANCISTIPVSASITSQTTSVCESSSTGSATVTATGGTTPYTYKWSTTPPITTATATGLPAGSYTVTVTDAFNNNATASTTISQNPLPQSFVVSGSGSYCSYNSGKMVNLDGSQTGVNYILTPGNIQMPGTGSSLGFGLQPAGTFTITGVNATTGCTKMMTGNAVITSTQPLPVSISISTTTPTVFSDEEVTLTASPVNGGTSPAFQWKVNNQNIGLNNSTLVYSPSNGDEVKCVLTSSETCVTGNPATSNTIILSVQSILQNQTVIGSLASGEVTCYNALLTLTIAGNGNTFTVSNNSNVTLIAGQKIVFLPGAKVLSGGSLHGYITTNNQFCGQTGPSNPSTVTETTDNIDNSTGSSFKIYPNPATDYFAVEQTTDRPYNSREITVFALSGEKLISKTFQAERKHQINISELQSGLYFVKVITDGKIETFKLIKTR